VNRIPCQVGRLARRLTLAVLAAALSICVAGSGFAHEVRPAYLELVEDEPDTFTVLFKTPMLGDLRLALSVAFSGPVDPITPVVSRASGDALVQTWRARTSRPLRGQELRIVGLEHTISDALVRVTFLDGRSWLHRMTPAAPLVTIPVAQGWSDVAATYLGLGVEHILLGFDHLLFVLGLILITANTRQLVTAITAFTAAHSITLAAATLGIVHVPPKPVEACIALSIAFLAAEILRARTGRGGIAVRAPWLVAFAFGLLHGLGFAGALSEIGMPEGHIPVALLFFNLGVEAGQLLFVAGVMAVVTVAWQTGSPSRAGRRCCRLISSAALRCSGPSSVSPSSENRFGRGIP
jgi:hydrogenase/urease accessory protein HupE